MIVISMIGENMSALNLIKSYMRRATRDSLLGVGCYSAVLRANNSKDQVIKIGSQADDPWIDYYREVVHGISTPHTPKIHRFYKEPNGSFYVAIMEKLESLDRAHIDFVNAVREYAYDEISYADLVEQAKSMTGIPNAEAFVDFIDYLIDKTDVIRRGGWDEYEMDARTLDIHSGNWMLRRDGTLVLIDPWAHYEIEADLERWAEDNLYNKYGYAV